MGRASHLFFSALLTSALLTCAGCGGQPPTPELRIPQFPFAALQGPYVRSAKLYIDATGVVTKTAVLVEPEALPSWVLVELDERVGEGKDLRFEIEQYRGGDRVYEITREIDGHTIELALRADRSFKYMVRDIALETAPVPTLKTARAVEGFVPQRASHKKGPGLEYYSFEGVRQGRAYAVRVDPAGVLLDKRKIIKAQLAVQPFH